MNCWTDVSKDFDSKTEAMRLKCPCGNAEGINDLVLYHQALVHIEVFITCSVGAYTASDSAPAQNRIWPCETINDRANI